MASRRNRTSNQIRSDQAPKGGDRSPRSETANGEDERSTADPGKRVMKAALNILAARSCSEGQLRERLTAKDWVVEANLVEECIARLKELGLINDALFARSYANYRVNSKPLGRARLARELALKKVPRDRANEALDMVFAEAPEDALIDRAIARRLRTHGRPADRAAAKRMFDHLARLGFEYDLIVKKLSSIRTNKDSE